MLAARPNLSANNAAWVAAVKARALDTDRLIELVLQQTGQEVIDYLRSYATESMAPPFKKGGAPRPRHPGGWADRTSVLAASYAWDVEPIPNGWRLVLANTAEYAAYLEAHDGYFVLGGITEPNGPVYEALKNVAAQIAPTWTVDFRGVQRMILQGPPKRPPTPGTPPAGV